MLGLILAGEAVYALPFHLTRYFRPSMLEIMELSATELGAAQSIYGIVAMLAYFPGGPLADRFSTRKLLAMSLWSTSLGGIYLATFPGYQGALFIWGFFGVTTILLFWAALIKATRDWGGTDSQGRAYGILDGGRGLLAAALASIGVMVFDLAFPDGYAAASPEQRQDALRTVIYGYTLVTAGSGLFVWFAIAEVPGSKAPARNLTRGMGEVMKLPAVWMQAMIVVCAYVGFKGIDNYSLFAVQVYGLDPVEAGEIVALGAWARPFAALGAGLLGDKLNKSTLLTLLFLTLLASHLFFATNVPETGAAWVLLSNVLLASIAVFALRGLYFSVFEDARVPRYATGTAVGVVSVIGYTPDVFAYYVAGVLIDTYPGIVGHQYYFWFLAAFAALGAAVSFAFGRVIRRQRRAIRADSAVGSSP